MPSKLSLVCQMTRFGVAAIFGPQSDVSADHVQSMCQTLKIPHIQTRWDPSSRPADDIDKNANITNIEIVISKESVNHQQQKLMSINLYPHPESLSRVCATFFSSDEIRNHTEFHVDIILGLFECGSSIQLEIVHHSLSRRGWIDPA